jgi:DNA-binding LytR/AlgR family response regulator
MVKQRSRAVKKMNIVICDDDLNFAQILKSYISSYAADKDITNQVQLCYSSAQLLDLELSVCDVLFLDIEMPGIKGIEAARILREHYKDLLLVFVTGWIEYAPSGYQVNAFRYLLKKELPTALWDCLDDIQKKLFENAETIVLQGRESCLRIPLNRIIYFEGTRQNIVYLHQVGEDVPFECHSTLQQLADALQEKGFLRIQKSFLVNMVHIDKIRNYTVFLHDGTALKASERQYAKINQQYLLWRGRVL